MDITLHLRIAGHVQGVGYRYSLLGEAVAAGLAGWVRNRRDGTVEAVLQGEAAAVNTVVAWARRGPTNARVDRVDVKELKEESRYPDFAQRPTA